MFRFHTLHRISIPHFRPAVARLLAPGTARTRSTRVGLSLLLGAAAVTTHGKSTASCTAVVDVNLQQLHRTPKRSPKDEAVPKQQEKEQALTWAEALAGWMSSASQYIRVWYRMAYCSTVVSSVAWLAPWILFFQDKEALYMYITRCIQHLGPTFIKLAQWASSRPDLFDEELIVHLVKMQDSTETYPLSVTHNTLRHEFGADWADTLSIDPEPIGSGCIAQVYKGRLRPYKGAPDSACESVAVKVIHPHVDDMVRVDMGILRGLADMVSRWPKLQYLSLSETVDIFADNMITQLDLRREAEHIDRFIENFKEEDNVSFPKPFHDHVTRHVLVEELVEGKPITFYATDEYDATFKQNLCNMAIHGMLKMVFNDNFTHGDLHPGNILVRMTDKGPKIVFLDCGIVTDARDKHEMLLDIVLAFVKFDGYKAGKLMLEQRGDDPGVEGFCEGVRDIVNKSIAERSLEHMGEYVNMLCALSYKYKVKMMPEFLTVAMAIKVSEGVGVQLNPDLEFSKVAVPYIMKAQSKYMLEKTLHKLHIE